MKIVKLFKGTRVNTGGFQRFGFSVNNIDHIYRSSEKETILWVNILTQQIRSLTADFRSG